MSKIALKPNASGTGVFSLEAPNSNVDRTLTLPDEAGSVLTDVSDIEPQVKTATNASGSAPIYACRAWVNFDGGNTTISGSGNVSSITDNPDGIGTGNYRVNFTTSMPDSVYSAVVGPSSDGVTGSLDKIISQDSSGCNFFHYTGSNDGQDHTNFSVAVFR